MDDDGEPKSKRESSRTDYGWIEDTFLSFHRQRCVIIQVQNDGVAFILVRLLQHVESDGSIVKHHLIEDNTCFDSLRNHFLKWWLASDDNHNFILYLKSVWTKLSFHRTIERNRINQKAFIPIYHNLFPCMKFFNHGTEDDCNCL